MTHLDIRGGGASRIARLLIVCAAFSFLASCGGPFGGGSLPRPIVISPADDPADASRVSPLTVKLAWQTTSSVSQFVLTLRSDGVVKSMTTTGNELLAAQLWGCPLDELAQYDLTVTAVDGSQESPETATTFFTKPDDRTGQWLLGATLVDSSGNELDGHVPDGAIGPTFTMDRHDRAGAASRFIGDDGTAVEIELPADGSWPELGLGFSFSVWVRLPAIENGESHKDQTIFAKRRPGSSPLEDGRLYGLSVNYAQDGAGDQSCTFTLFFADSIDGGTVWIDDVIAFPKLTGTSILGEQWIHVAGSYEYGAGAMTAIHLPTPFSAAPGSSGRTRQPIQRS